VDRPAILRAGVAVLLLAAALGLFHRALFDARYAIPYDLPEYHFPLAWQIAQGLREGRLALWDPYTYCGFPLHANLQAQMFYPPAWPFFMAGAAFGPDRLRTLLEWQIALHVWLAGLFAYGLARRLGLSRSAALFAALGFELSGYFVSQAQHLGAICGAAWIPLAWRAVVEAGEKRDARRATMLAAALAMSFLAGFTAVTVVAYASTGLLALLLWLRRPREWRLLPVAAGGALLSIILSAVQLLPTVELSRLSTVYRRGTFSDDGGGVPWQGLVSLIAPERYGVLHSLEPRFGVNPSFLYLYAGWLTVVMALAALARKSAWRAPLLCTALFHLIWLMGGHTPPGLWAYRALPPAVRSALYQEFAMPAFLLTLCLLAGLGFEWTVAARSRLAAALLVCAAAADPISRAASSWFVASPAENFPAVTRDLFEESPESGKAARRILAASMPPARLEIFRDSLHWMSHAPVLGIATPNGNDPLAMERLLEVRRIYAPMPEWVRTSDASQIPSRVLDLLNVGALVAWDDNGPAPPEQHYPFVEAVHAHRFYANPRALPRFFLAGGVVSSSSLAETIAILKRNDFDPASAVVVEGAAPAAGRGSFQPVRVIRYEPEIVELEYETAVPAVLVSSEAAHPGWRAALDGREAPLLLVNGAFRGVAAPPGKHRVVMRYTPLPLQVGAPISLAALAAAAAAAFWRARSMRSPTP
jgi:hypothetical protein